MAWIAQPLTFYAMLALGMFACVMLFLTLKKENARLKSGLEDHRRLTAEKMDELRSSILRIQVGLEQVQAEAKAQTPAPGVDASDMQSVNMGKRSLVMRMHRRGETTDEISTTLHIPRSEVDLMLKVHRVVMEQT